MTAPPLLVLAGPTGTGKTALSLDVADALRERSISAEVVNGDAMQLYRGMDVGTAKLPPADRRGIPHHLLDVLEVSETATVAAYQRDARAAIDDIRGRGGVPVLVGGSGLYLAAVLTDLDFPGTDPTVRARWEATLAAEGGAALWARLEERDPEAAARIDPANSRRVVRALEVIEFTGLPYAASLPDESPHRIPSRVHFVDVPSERRDELKLRLARRAREMFANGLVDETRVLLGHGLRDGQTAARAIGYAQAIGVVDGRLTEEEAIDSTIQATWRYVRRQRAWFGRFGGDQLLEAGSPGLLTAVLRGIDGAQAQ